MVDRVQHFAQVAVVRAVGELEGAAVAEEVFELDGQVLAHVLEGEFPLHFEDGLVLLLLVAALDAHPGEVPFG